MSHSPNLANLALRVSPCPTPDKPQAISDLTALIADYVELYDKGWGATDAEWVEWMRDFLDWEAEYYE